MRGAVRSVVGVAVAVTVAITFLADPAAAGVDPPVMSVAKHAGGPYHDDLQDVNLGVGQAKNFYFKAKNKNDGQISPLLTGTGDDENYKVRWFKGNENITDLIVDPDYIQPSIPAGGTRKYRARVKHVSDPGEGYCLDLTAFGPVPTATVLVGVNVSCFL